ncbi:hypothetical protein ACWKWU_12320 [Chitinophaga lutea]
MKKFLLSLAGLAAALAAQGQGFPKHAFRAALELGLPPAVTVQAELRLSDQMTAVGKYSTILTYGYSDALGSGGSVSYQPSAELRWYYNVDRRIAKGKSVEGFSGNYLSVEPAVRAGVTFFGKNPDTDSYAPDFSLYLSYGLQRRLGRLGYMGFTAGAGPAIYDGDLGGTARVVFQIGLQW